MNVVAIYGNKIEVSLPHSVKFEELVESTKRFPTASIGFGPKPDHFTFIIHFDNNDDLLEWMLINS